VWVELGLMRDDAGLPVAARMAYRRGVAADSNNPWARGCLAWAELRRGMLPAALYHGWLAVRLDARYADAYTILATAVERLGARASAMSLLERAMQLDPRRNWAYLELARMLDEDGRTQEAVSLLGVLLELVPDDDQVRELRDRLVHSSSKRAGYS
jgi:tetratricopeptide (TPR) repeat protein